MQWPWICVEDKGTAWEQKNAPHYLTGVGYALVSSCSPENGGRESQCHTDLGTSPYYTQPFWLVNLCCLIDAESKTESRRERPPCAWALHTCWVSSSMGPCFLCPSLGPHSTWSVSVPFCNCWGVSGWQVEGTLLQPGCFPQAWLKKECHFESGISGSYPSARNLTFKQTVRSS